jgi:hypothetical protein
MGVLSEIDSEAPCYPAFPQLTMLHEWHRDGVNHAPPSAGGSRLLAGPMGSRLELKVAAEYLWRA